MRVVIMNLICLSGYLHLCVVALCGCRATPLLLRTCPFLDHHPDALIERVGVPKQATVRMLLLVHLVHLF